MALKLNVFVVCVFGIFSFFFFSVRIILAIDNAIRISLGVALSSTLLQDRKEWNSFRLSIEK
jgi:hypothetical protein